MEALNLNPFNGTKEEPVKFPSKEEVTKDPMEQLREDFEVLRLSLDSDNLRKLISQGLAKEIKNLNLSDFQTLTHELKEMRFQLGAFQERRNNIFTKKGVLLGLAMLFGSLLTSGGIYYFFPQKVVLNRAADLESYKMFQQGTLLKLALKKMSKVEQERIQRLMDTCWEEYYKALVKG